MRNEYVPVEHENEVRVGLKMLLNPCLSCGGRHEFAAISVGVKEGVDEIVGEYGERRVTPTRAWVVAPAPHFGEGKALYFGDAIRQKRLWRVEQRVEDAQTTTRKLVRTRE